MHTRKLLLSLALLLCCAATNAQTWIRDYADVYDTVWDNEPNAAIYRHGYGALISCSIFGSPIVPAFYQYNYMVRVDDNGDMVWEKRNALDTSLTIYYTTVVGGVPVYGPHLDQFQSLVKSVTQLKGNGNYIVAGSSRDTVTSATAYVLKQYNPAGATVSDLVLMDSMREYTRDIKVIAADSNSFYVLYNSDSFYYTTGGTFMNKAVSYVSKYHDNFSLLWTKTYEFDYAYSSSVSFGTLGLQVPTAVVTADNGIACIRNYDSAVVAGAYPRYYLEKVLPTGAVDWQVMLCSVMGTSAYPEFAGELVATHDNGVIVSAQPLDTASMTYLDVYLMKFGTSGAMTDSVHIASDTAQPFNGIELSTGKLLFTSGYLPEFFMYDEHLHYLYSMPYPFAENGFHMSSPIVANPYGGAFCAFQGGNPVYLPSWHIVGVNFDSLFQCYPSYINGSVYLDNNHDCVHNTGDLWLNGGMVLAHDAVTGHDFYSFASPTGNYTTNVPPGNYTLAHPAMGHKVNECGGYTHSITSPVIISGDNFADTLIPGINDLLLNLYGTGVVPGDTPVLYLGAFNNGTTTVDTTVFVTLDPLTTYVSSYPAPASVSGGVLTYNLHLLPDSSTYFNIHVATATTATLGDPVHFSAYSPFPDNVVPTNDSSDWDTHVVSSWDPNCKSSNQPLYFPRNNTIVYTVQFQNTGSYKAKNIVVIDTLDARLDPGTFQLLDADRMMPVVNWKDGNRLYFTFSNINLPDSASNPDGSHGWFSYAIRVKSSVPLGDTVRNSASIYFDYNLPVKTNTQVNILRAPTPPLAVQAQAQRAEINLYPNPTNGAVTITVPLGDGWSADVSDVMGRHVRHIDHVTANSPVELTTQPGIYLVTISNSVTHEKVTRKMVVR